MTRMPPRTPEDYARLPYHFVLLQDEWEDGTAGWFVRVDELEGCMSQGGSPEEAIGRAREAILAWTESEIEAGHEIPLPREEPDASGRFLVRLPRGLHNALAAEARREGVSLNQFVTAALAGTIGWRSRDQRNDKDRAAS